LIESPNRRKEQLADYVDPVVDLGNGPDSQEEEGIQTDLAFGVASKQDNGVDIDRFAVEILDTLALRI
jgi:hypothetical protein